MFDDIPIVPNLYEAPSNPQAKDCYYNITLDKYYIYDGSQWLEAKLEGNTSEDQDTFELKYSMDGGETFTTEIYTNFDELRTALNSPPINNAFYIGITLFSNPAILIPRTDNVSLRGVALLKLQNTTNPKPVDIFKLKYSKDNGSTYVTEVYWDFSILEDRMNSSVLNGVTNIEVSMLEGNDPYGENTDTDTVQKIFCLKYSKDGGTSYITETYNNFNDLTDRTHSSVMEGVTDIKVSVETIDPSIVGRIYPKIIFNQQLVKKLNVNKNNTLESVFDGVLVFHKIEPHYRLSWIDSSSENHSMIFSNYTSLKTYIENEISSGSMIDVSIEEVEEE